MLHLADNLQTRTIPEKTGRFELQSLTLQPASVSSISIKKVNVLLSSFGKHNLVLLAESLKYSPFEVLNTRVLLHVSTLKIVKHSFKFYCYKRVRVSETVFYIIYHGG